MKLRDLTVGQQFKFEDRPHIIYEYRGNGWYATPTGFDGGPWYKTEAEDTVPVIPLDAQSEIQS